MTGSLQRLTTLALMAGFAAFASAQAGDDTSTQPKDKPMSIHDITVNDIDGKEIKLATYAGDVLLIVNVASK